MSIGDIAVYIIALIAAALLAAIILNKFIALIKGWRKVLSALGWLVLIGSASGVILIGLGIAVFFGAMIYKQVTDQRMMQQCMTLYERKAKAYAAPDDYFGQQLRRTIDSETKSCAEFAANKEAAKILEK